jgi:hypothetical protein
MNPDRVICLDSVYQCNPTEFREMGKAVIQTVEYMEKTLILKGFAKHLKSKIHEYFLVI